jgi:hypothetical protein
MHKIILSISLLFSCALVSYASTNNEVTKYHPNTLSQDGMFYTKNYLAIGDDLIVGDHPVYSEELQYLKDTREYKINLELYKKDPQKYKVLLDTMNLNIKIAQLKFLKRISHQLEIKNK